MLRGLFEGAQYNSEAWAKCAVYSRAQTKQGREVIKEIRYVYNVTHFGELTTSLRINNRDTGKNRQQLFFLTKVKSLNNTNLPV